MQNKKIFKENKSVKKTLKYYYHKAQYNNNQSKKKQNKFE